MLSGSTCSEAVLVDSAGPGLEVLALQFEDSTTLWQDNNDEDEDDVGEAVEVCVGRGWGW